MQSDVEKHFKMFCRAENDWIPLMTKNQTNMRAKGDGAAGGLRDESDYHSERNTGTLKINYQVTSKINDST